MAMSLFHPFPRLPAELRLQIWQAACVVSSPSDRRLQYVTARDGQAVPLPCKWRQSREQVSLEEKNRSAYLIDGGLWKACKESREVIAQHSHFCDWVRIQKQACVDWDYFDRCPADWAGGEEFPHPAIIDTCEGEEECRMLVYPSSDIFCLQTDDWVALRGQFHNSKLEMSFIRYNKDNGMSMDDELDVRNIALEFNRNWFLDIPSGPFDYYDNNSAPGYFAYLVCQKRRSLGTFDGLWIIDKDAKWFGELSEHPDTVYRDCDAEYIEVGWYNVVRYDGSRGVSDFMWRIDDWLLESDDLESCDRQSNPDYPGPKDLFRLLVRRDNQVQDPRIDNEAIFNGVGWLLFKDDDLDGCEDSDFDGDSDAGSHEDPHES